MNGTDGWKGREEGKKKVAHSIVCDPFNYNPMNISKINRFVL